MKIDIISALFGRPGGAENASRTLAEALLRQGVDVRVVGTRDAAQSYSYATVLKGTERIPTLVLLYGWNPLLDAYLARRVLEYFRERRPEIVLLEDHMLFRAAMKAVARYNAEGGSAKLVMSQIWDVDSRFYYEFRPLPLAWWLCRHFWALNALSRKMDLVNAYIQFNRDELVRHFGLDPGKIIMAQSTGIEPVQIPRPTRPPSKARFVAPARICPEKGALFMLDAAERLLTKTEEFSVEFFGGGPSERKLRAEIKKRGLAPWVTLHGLVSQDVLWRAITSASATCVPVMNPPGYTCIALESLSAGVPLIAFDHGGMPDIIDQGLTGFRVKPRDAEAFAEAMYAFVENPNLTLDMERACREMASSMASPDEGAAALHRALVERFGGESMDLASAAR